MQKRSPEEVNPLVASYVILFIFLLVIDVFMFFSREKIVSIGRKGLVHSIAAAFVAFVAMILFNPFHLTNLTHTFVISISKHAEMWRTVNEWHPGFEWGNPVGTSYPFLIMLVLFIAAASFYLFSRQLVPKILSGTKERLSGQPQLFNFLLKIFAFSAAIFLFWMILLSFAFIDYDPISLLICTSFAAIILLSIFLNIYFSTLLIPILLFAMSVSLTLTRPAFEGRYIYPFIIIPAYCIILNRCILVFQKG